MSPCSLVELYRRVWGTHMQSSLEQNSLKVFCMRPYAEPLNRKAEHLLLIQLQGRTEITKLKERVKVKCIQWRHLVFCYLSIVIVIIIIINVGSSALLGLGLLKQMSPATSILVIRPPISTTWFPCFFLYPVNQSWFRSARSSLTSWVCPQYLSR